MFSSKHPLLQGRNPQAVSADAEVSHTISLTPASLPSHLPPGVWAWLATCSHMFSSSFLDHISRPPWLRVETENRICGIFSLRVSAGSFCPFERVAILLLEARPGGNLASRGSFYCFAFTASGYDHVAAAARHFSTKCFQWIIGFITCISAHGLLYVYVSEKVFINWRLP